MLHVDIPTRPEFKALTELRSDACVSIYLPTTPLSQQSDASRIELGNLVRSAREQLEAAGFDKRRLALLLEHFDDLDEDEAFWRLQANSLAVLATPDRVQTFRLPNALTAMVQVSDRFHLKPLLRSITFPYSAFVLALSENAVRVVEVHADLPPVEIKVPDLPKDAASALGKSTLNDRSHSRRIHGSEGQNVRFRQFARQVDGALRPVLSGRHTPLIIAGTGRLPSIFRSISSYPELLEGEIETSPDRMTEAEIAAAARPLLDKRYADEIAELRALYETRASDGRATSDISDAARAATHGAVEVLLVDIDHVVPGRVSDADGKVELAKEEDATNYGVVDEIAGRALASGARVLGVRREDLPAGGDLAAILRYAV